ncbi:aromatic acid exporter family protein [Streptomyces gobiensis]|uniref:aromatic acid exporter family protein n=1 Tax=Streptomyces gobiensis TaxID=2875706 RepID=UPI001E4173E2|nr:aromatic acid exporter family protein [Streptomyces gobiensis]UGY92889.1 aromatic acid exporter family protein [Streptomyces gobiensis]
MQERHIPAVFGGPRVTDALRAWAARASVSPWAGRLVVATRASVAAALAWQLCRVVLNQSHPYPAALAALLVVHPTVFRSLRAGAAYAAGCALGALVALPATIAIGPTWLGLAVVVLLSVLVGSHERLGHFGTHAPITALFVLLLDRSHLTAELVPHLVAIAVGVAVGVVFNATLVPPLRLRPAEAGLERARGELTTALDGLARAVADGQRPDEVLGPRWRDAMTAALQEARGSLDQAHESLRWNFRAGARRTVWHLDQGILATLERVAADVTALARSLERAASAPDGHGLDESFRADYARLLKSTALCVRECGGGRPHPALPATRRMLERLAEPVPEGEMWAVKGRLLMFLERTLYDLAGQGPAREENHAQVGSGY